MTRHSFLVAGGILALSCASTRAEAATVLGNTGHTADDVSDVCLVDAGDDTNTSDNGSQPAVLFTSGAGVQAPPLYAVWTPASSSLPVLAAYGEARARGPPTLGVVGGSLRGRLAMAHSIGCAMVFPGD